MRFLIVIRYSALSASSGLPWYASARIASLCREINGRPSSYEGIWTATMAPSTARQLTANSLRELSAHDT